MTPAKRKVMGERFKLAREAVPQYSKQEVCRENCITEAQLDAIEAGELEPTAWQAYMAAGFFGVQLSWLLGSPSHLVPDSDSGATGDAELHADIAGQIRQAREEAGLTVYQAALALGVPISYLEEIESADRRLDFGLGVRACVLFGADPDAIVRPADGERPPGEKASS
jgi:transcriptional regulator with XRE-family HTH domain